MFIIRLSKKVSWWYCLFLSLLFCFVFLNKKTCCLAFNTEGSRCISFPFQAIDGVVYTPKPWLQSPVLTDADCSNGAMPALSA